MKLFITSKVYDTDTMTEEDIEREVQKDVDNYVGKGKVIFKISINKKTATIYFWRGVDCSRIDTTNQIMDVDVYMVTGHGYKEFRMPYPLPPMPLPGYIRSIIEQSEFLKAYKKSAVMLGGDKIKKACLDINDNRIILTVNVK